MKLVIYNQIGIIRIFLSIFPNMFVLKIVTDFASAHSLRDYPGDCARLHGHNWQVEVSVCSQVLDDSGIE